MSPNERMGGGGGSGGPIIALMPKSTTNAFFFPVRDGCKARASAVGGSCIFVGPDTEDPTGALQAVAIHDIIEAHINGTQTIDGLAVSVVNADAVLGPFRRAVEDASLPVITFDSDAPDSQRMAYIGTNNTAFGEQLGKGLLQLRPQGGSYALVATEAPNLQKRVAGVRDVLEGTRWTELPNSLINERLDEKRGLTQMTALTEERGADIDAMVPCLAGPMNLGPEWQEFVEANRNLTLVVGDAMPHQIALFEKGYAHGLVGQLPYQAGELCVDTLLGLARDNAMQQQQEQVYGTNLNLLLRIPLTLPPVNQDMNYIGNLGILGYVLAGIVLCLSFCFAGWTFAKRNVRVVKASQPIFLGMICAGVAIMGASIIPMAIEESDAACMLIPWLLCVGFATTFAAMFSKTMRINRIMRNATRCSRVKVSARDVMGPFVALLAANVVVLACWTAISPLKYMRATHIWRDPWGRVLSTYGYCGSSGESWGGSVPFYVFLIILDLGVLVVSNVQAYQARNVSSEYSESHWIAIVMASMLQVGIIGIPLLFLVGEAPQASFVVRAFIVFATCMSCTLFLFVPKVLHEKRRSSSSAATKEASQGSIFWSTR
mmetsp:Transcript_3117/g.4743  ORF Transcript_3117/g.4743 Transcript_3117/m.4743 type:complete len:602 (-) Transcript_3117:212-2017(-)